MESLPAPEPVYLNDGTALTIRPIRPDDAPRLRALHSRLSPESIYLRFLGMHPVLSQREAERLANLDYETRMAFVATFEEAGEESIVGVARYDLVPPDRPEEAEAAIVVEDRYQGQGLGSLLLDRLLAYARAHGVRTFVAEISAENERMMRFVRRSGLPAENRLEDGVWEVRINIGGEKGEQKMEIGILGTGTVGQIIGAKLAELGHEVMIGTRDVANTLAQSEPDAMGNPPFSAWHKQHTQVTLGAFTEAAAHGEIVINATNGAASLDALNAAGEADLNGKILMDIANPLDFSQGMPPSLSVSNTDSLGEQIQRAFPQVKVVKTLNTVTASLMADPRQLADGDHHVFVSGDDAEAKARVTEYLKTWFGWKHVLDLGDITTARGPEMYLPIWLQLWGALQTPMFNFKVVHL